MKIAGLPHIPHCSIRLVSIPTCDLDRLDAETPVGQAEEVSARGELILVLTRIDRRSARRRRLSLASQLPRVPDGTFAARSGGVTKFLEAANFAPSLPRLLLTSALPLGRGRLALLATKRSLPVGSKQCLSQDRAFSPRCEQWHTNRKKRSTDRRRRSPSCRRGLRRRRPASPRQTIRQSPR